MNISDFRESLEYLFKAQVTPFIWGHAGIGKSSIIKQYATSKGYHFFPLYLGTQSDLGDVLGLADFVRDANGTAIATTFATPVWLKNAIQYCEENPSSGAILFLDEFNRARRDVLQGMFSLALDKTFHTIKLPANCHIVAAGNPPTDEYYVTDVNETALMARFAHIKLEPSVQEWVEYAQGQNYDSNLVGFIQEQPGLLEDAKSDFKLPVKVDRRAYGRVQSLMDAGTPKSLLSQLMQGILGIERVVAYEKFLASADKPLTAEEILSNAGWGKIDLWSKGSDIKASLLTSSTENLSTYLFSLKDENVKIFDEAKQDIVVKYIMSVPVEIAYNFVSAQIKQQSEAFRLLNNNPIHMNAILERLKSSKVEKQA